MAIGLAESSQKAIMNANAAPGRRSCDQMRLSRPPVCPVPPVLQVTPLPGLPSIPTSPSTPSTTNSSSFTENHVNSREFHPNGLEMCEKVQGTLGYKGTPGRGFWSGG